MIFKVYFQENKNEVPIRENTKSIYMDANSIEEVRKKLSNTNYNIEFVQEIKGKFLEYEQQSDSFEVEKR
ncbi:DNA-directed RNA polymerase subunit epsilon [Fictibacillus sp. WQ 8-8]|uniref:DNA-dependent RNA polymerase subunit epsilon n=1 Tax=unclassified Fictibacillus TaxID=2644029 RepID=UPI0006A79765|nr:MULTISPECIES: DNA-directed RNA polymerase subunit epsilon [unclassified Fictibacillus]MCQ6265627.1 DNA-directed RNA polymerase subunit epsilon [Fictibacillus sp. WQ 8-8]MED2973491.1 DNA-directed RNA polymerase subunit epsilon [Fictibacillus sp. B-59209]UZJ77324.1 DNA-directed RNA polymerase subunit epsilon [Fictibacillus sp. KU28468]SFE09628.1 DNA-dependent RNA polymerase auxiliary subunit epsilon [Bacillus sp. OV194]